MQKVRYAVRRWKKGELTRKETIAALVDAGLMEMAAISQFESWTGDGRARQKQRLVLRERRGRFRGPMRGR